MMPESFLAAAAADFPCIGAASIFFVILEFVVGSTKTCSVEKMPRGNSDMGIMVSTVVGLVGH